MIGWGSRCHWIHGKQSLGVLERICSYTLHRCLWRILCMPRIIVLLRKPVIPIHFDELGGFACGWLKVHGCMLQGRTTREVHNKFAIFQFSPLDAPHAYAFLPHSSKASLKNFPEKKAPLRTFTDLKNEGQSWSFDRTKRPCSTKQCSNEWGFETEK